MWGKCKDLNISLQNLVMIQPRTSPPKFAPSPRPESNTVKKQSAKHRVKKQSETQSEQQTEKTVLNTAVQNCVNASVRRAAARRLLGASSRSSSADTPRTSLCELLPPPVSPSHFPPPQEKEKKKKEKKKETKEREARQLNTIYFYIQVRPSSRSRQPYACCFVNPKGGKLGESCWRRLLLKTGGKYVLICI